MRLHGYRDETHSHHLDLIGRGWSIDLITAILAILLLAAFVSALLVLLGQ
jgi:hypothetical protein